MGVRGVGWRCASRGRSAGRDFGLWLGVCGLGGGPEREKWRVWLVKWDRAVSQILRRSSIGRRGKSLKVEGIGWSLFFFNDFDICMGSLQDD